MIRAFLTVAAALTLAALPIHAADEWGLPKERAATFEATVVDVVCRLTGDCPAGCGGGRRQLGLLTKDGRLILPLKNYVAFAGAAVELLPFCGGRVVADGAFTTRQGLTVFALQYVGRPGEPRRKTDRFLQEWARRQGVAPDSPTAEQWFRHDPRVKAVIDKDGKLGLGLEAERKAPGK